MTNPTLWNGAAVVLAPGLASYPRLPYRGEDARAVVRVEPCACGGTVHQLAGEDIPAAVTRHNAGMEHMVWRAER